MQLYWRSIGNIQTMIYFRKKTRQIIKYRVAATLRRAQIKKYTTSKEAGGYKTNGNIV